MHINVYLGYNVHKTWVGKNLTLGDTKYSLMMVFACIVMPGVNAKFKTNWLKERSVVEL